MSHYKLTIEYDGTHFKGWQIQAKGERTIVGEMQKACTKIFNQKCNVIGSGRTDSGVHAHGQVAHIKVTTRLKPQEIMNALNAHVPKDISILDVKKVKSTFHAQFSAKSKIYRYTILNRSQKCARQRFFMYHHPTMLNVAAMRQGAKYLLGRHDFKSFQASDPKRKEMDTTRTIKKLRITKENDLIHIDIEANGFLYKMVRNIVGTLLKVGQSKLTPADVKRILKEKDRTKAAYTAKALGLTLLEVKY